MEGSLSGQRAFLGLGSNVGDRLANLRLAVDELDASSVIDLLAVSSIYETEPVGEVTDQADFLNAAAEIVTELEPLDLLGVIKEIEQNLGRTRNVVHGPREIDIDLLIYDSIEGSFGELADGRPALVLPHPLNLQRRFVLTPLIELDPELCQPDGCWLIDALERLGPGQRLERQNDPDRWRPRKMT